MNADDVEAFRIRYRLERLERFCTAMALTTLMQTGMRSDESRQFLKSWFERDSATADVSFGAHFKEPAQAAIYSDEVKAMADSMRRLVDTLTDAIEGR